MIAMSLSAPGAQLIEEHRPDPTPGPGEVRLRVRACGVCRTDLHVVDGDLPPRRLPVVPGHEVVGRVDAVGPGVSGLRVGDRVGAPWLAQACGRCRYCREGRENLCDDPAFNGWTRDGGYADMMIARADFCLPIPPSLTDSEAAPLLCAGLIGFRAWRMACAERPVHDLGLFGFGAAAHLLAQLAICEGQSVHAFTRDGDRAAQDLALSMGCVRAEASRAAPAAALDAAIIFAPDGDLVPLALRAVRKGGVVVCGGIHMSDIPSFPYALLWEERRLVSVANLTRQDGRDYLPWAVRAGVRPHVTTYPLSRANQALEDLRRGAFTGAGVLVPDQPAVGPCL
ncbi:MAG: zinc-binding alcohol dehydrogenase family protein [Brevundimonas sp.]|jgi:propanol-preferring alcohol dehydrogenase|uniref:zinc-binding alcohol dehydrogenase family protein n=1 Tax=Brevundimonas sp. TaxID=1871086 RepID=UPI0025B9FA0F|nr:zinc-binding alcohol dehydrogenase family protein [Brevundimonas sp.]MCH4267289.1 zinc-binding alcohol dehydrogenase family protein [Brevundimonas sp.]